VRRRCFLRSAGVVTVAALGGGLWRAGDQGVFSIGQGPAYEAWKNWRDTNDGPLTLVRAAILAASPHNTQPWLFKVTDSSIELYIDTQRNVGALDPYLREEHIGIGCAMENLILAARANGYAATVTIQPGQLEALPVDPQPRLLARVDLAPGKREESALYEAIPRRHTNRGPYDPHKPIPSDFLETLGRLPGEDADAKLFLFTAEEDRKKIAELISAANTEIYSDPQVQRGSDRWVRMKWSSVEEHRDGLTIDAFGLSPVADAVVKMMTPGMLRLAGPHKEKNRYLNLMLSAPLLGFIAVRDRYEQEQCLGQAESGSAPIFSRPPVVWPRVPAMRPLKWLIMNGRSADRPPVRPCLMTSRVTPCGRQPLLSIWDMQPCQRERVRDARFKPCSSENCRAIEAARRQANPPMSVKLCASRARRANCAQVTG
jgi:hypothetical protein